MANIAILGAGIAGFGAAHRLHAEGIRPVVYEKNEYHGGNTASFRLGSGFVYDLGPHVSFTKDPRIQELLANSVDQDYETIQISLNNYWRGFWPQHPVQVHLHGLPQDVVVKIISDFVDEQRNPNRPIRTYADWLLASFGRTFAELFPMQYTKKYHLATADNMSTDWLGPRLYKPTLEEMLRGALSPSNSHVHYITHFRYPTEGGFVSYLRKFLPNGKLRLNHRLVALDPNAHRLCFSNGSVAYYDSLISSLPLPELIRMINNAPQDVQEASRRLACSSCVLVNIGVAREDLSNAHMTYFYDADICFTRLSFPHMLSPRNAPPGKGSIQAEIYFSNKYKPMNGRPEDWISRVAADLRRCNILHDTDRILFQDAVTLQYANVIFDLERAAAVKTVHGYLDDVGIAYCGRYGDWGYLWTDESFTSGERAAEQALKTISASGRPAAHTMVPVGGVV